MYTVKAGKAKPKISMKIFARVGSQRETVTVHVVTLITSKYISLDDTWATSGPSRLVVRPAVYFNMLRGALER